MSTTLIETLNHPLPTDIGLPDHTEHNRRWFDITVQVRAAADEMMLSSLEGVQYRPHEGIYPGAIVHAVAEAIGANEIFVGKMGKHGLPDMARHFVEGRRDLIVKELIDREPVGSDTDADDRQIILRAMRPALPSVSGISHATEEQIVAMMAKRDKARAVMTTDQKRDMALDMYFALAVGNAEYQRDLPHDTRVRLLALAQAESFLVDLVGPESSTAVEFYVTLAGEVHKTLNDRRGDVQKIYDPLRIGIATALYRDELDKVTWGPREGFGIGRTRAGVGAPESQFARMMRSLTRRAYLIAVSTRLFNETEVDSPAQQLVDAFKLYLDNAGMGDKKVQAAFAASRKHIRDVVLATAGDVITLAQSVPPISMHQIIAHEAGNGTMPPVSSPEVNKRRAINMVKNIADAIVAIGGSAASKPTVAGLFARADLDEQFKAAP